MASNSMWKALIDQVDRVDDRVAFAWFVMLMTIFVMVFIVALVALGVWGAHYGQ